MRLERPFAFTVASTARRLLMRLTINYFLLTSTLCLCSSGCSAPPAAVPLEAPRVSVMQPQKREIADHEEFNGWMAADDKVEVRARVKGHINKVHFTDGQYVKKGD